MYYNRFGAERYTQYIIAYTKSCAEDYGCRACWKIWHILILLYLLFAWLESESHILTLTLLRSFTAIKMLYSKGVDIYESSYLFIEMSSINPLTAKLFNLRFRPLEVVSRWRDPQLQVSENYSDLTKWRSTLFKYCWLMSHFIFNIFKIWYLMC